jgi:glutathione reductase (NADPH)
MAKYDFDLFVIGGGSGGVRAGRISGTHGARVGLAEEDRLGGTCVNVGCIPKKFLVYASHFAHEFADAAGYGWTVPAPSFDWATLIANKDKEIERLNGIYRRLLEGAGVKIFDSRATLVDANTVEVAGQHVTAERILVATGGHPFRPDIPGFEHAITSDQAFYLEKLPKRVVVSGGGYIAVEFAGVFNGLGSEVSLIYREGLFLRGFDTDIRTSLSEEMTRKGVRFRLHTVIERVEKASDCLTVHLSDGRMIECDCVLFALGRKPNTKGLGLAKVGVKCRPSDGAIEVDDHYRTSIKTIYAIGDVTNHVNLTPVATAEGHALADTLFGKNPRGIQYGNIPSAVFSDPPVATVGLTETQARTAFKSVDIYRTSFRPLKHTLTGAEERTMMKLVVDRATDRVIGCHIVGTDAPEMMQGIAVAINAGATKACFDRTIGIHPTAAEELVTMRTRIPDEIQEAAE